jgi:hypothetical protein
VKSTFYINNFNSQQPAQLIIEIGKTDIAFVILQNKIFTALAGYQLSKIEELNDLLTTENLLQNTFTKVDVVYSNKESMLVPPAYFNANATDNYIELIYGNVQLGEIKTDFLYKHNIHNVYKIDTEIVKAVNNKFPFANTSHQYSLLPDVAGLIGNKLYVIFYQNKFVVLSCIQNQLQLIQQFDYTNVEDAAYYLLAIVENHNMNVNELNVELNGMINENSTLYNELHKYFKHLSFTQLNSSFSYVTEIETLPSHYFAHLFSIAACV